MALNRRQIGRIAHSLAATLILLAPNLAGGRDSILTINGQNLHVETSGASGPTVVFEAGLGNDATTWKFIAGPVATFARVVLYDRAGLGQSLPMTKKDSAVTADEIAGPAMGLSILQPSSPFGLRSRASPASLRF
jgi:pimeloyl-ACP methyl ester carboxylesterase